ncbi:MAG: hypothetical protein U0Z26_04845 [Anaerolineales bacterium]
MNIFILKLILAPIIIGSASLAGRKWGAAVSGWIVGLPLTSGPVVFFVSLSHDRAFAFDTIRGVLSGGFSLVAYSLTYAWLAKRFDWKISFASAVLVFTTMTILLQNIIIPFIPLFFCIIGVIFLGAWLMPKYEAVVSTSTPGKWDIPSRILIGTSFIIFVTTIAPYIGARLTGLLTTIPLYVSILTVFAHRHDGAASGINVLRGLIYGLFAFASFFLVLGLLIPNHSLTVSFLAAILAALTTQGLTLLVLNRAHK